MNRFSPLSLGQHTLPNRLAIAAMHSNTADAEGYVTENTLNHYRNLLQVRPAVCFVEYSFVDKNGRDNPDQLGIHDDTCLDGLRQLATLIDQHHALGIIQLHHGGAKVKVSPDVMSPSGIKVPSPTGSGPASRVMTETDFDSWHHAFIKAAEHAVSAGFKGIELHAAHGYGLNQLLSPLTNQRQDRFGGNRENRAAWLLHLIKTLKSRWPALIVSVRMPGCEWLDGGITPADSLWYAKAMQEAGADLINISSGIGGWQLPDGRPTEGFLVPEASAIKPHLRIPVAGVGGITQGTSIDTLVKTGAIDIACVGRAILNGAAAFAEDFHQTPSESL